MESRFASAVEAAPGRVLSSESPPPYPRAKRQKIQLACSNCRDRKTRCDGGRPVCIACERRDVASTCIYGRAPFASRRDTAGLEDRLLRLEQREQVKQQQNFPHVNQANDCNSQTGQTLPAVNDEAPAPSNAGSTSNYGQSLSTQSQLPQRVDALATISPGDDDNCLYGESSTIAFVRHVAQVNRVNDSTTLISDREDGFVDNSAQVDSSVILLPLDLSLGKNDNHSALPLRRSADNYLHCFWEFVHPLFPVVHKTSFNAKYAKLWLPNDTPTSDVEELIFMSNLNLVFALGCQFSSQVLPNEKVSVAEAFYKKSQRVLLFEILGSTSVSVVQWLLLSGIYLQSTSHASHCWNSIGFAVRLAQSLGLHLEHSERREGNQIKREMRRRIWHTCVVLDRLLAMTFGRPVMVNKSYSTPVPSLIDDEYLRTEGDGTQPQSVPSRMGLFVSSCRLFEVLSEILSSFYAENPSVTLGSEPCMQKMVSDVLNFNRRLDSFITSIPDYLKTTQSSQVVVSDRDSCTNLQQQVLYCRFLYTRLLSLRPLLLMATKLDLKESTQAPMNANLSSLDDNIVNRCCNLCVNTAHRLIETIHQHLDTTYKSSGWHSVYFTFASATILLAGLRLPEVAIDTEATFEISWNRCLSIMNHYKDQIHTAPRAIQVLESLRSQIHEPHDQDSLRANGHREFSYEAPVGNGAMTPHIPSNFTVPLELSQFNPYGADSLSDAWFSQHVINLDGMTLDQLYS